MDELTPAMIDAFRAMATDMPVRVDITPLAGFALVATIQFALRHPQFPPSVGATAEAFARELQQHIAQRLPLVGELMEAGWDPAQDVPAEPSPARAATTRTTEETGR
jgi:hypothetical protein